MLNALDHIKRAFDFIARVYKRKILDLSLIGLRLELSLSWGTCDKMNICAITVQFSGVARVSE